MQEATSSNNSKVTKIALGTAGALALVGAGLAFFKKAKPMGYVTNIVGFTIGGLIVGVIAGNIVVNKKQPAV